jgi:hypothetical protein
MSRPPERPQRPGWDDVDDALESIPQRVGSIDRFRLSVWLLIGAALVAFWIIVIALLAGAFRPAPSSGQTTEPVDLSRPSSAALSGAPTASPAPSRTEAPVPSPSAAPTGEVGPVTPPVALAGWATWCAPTATQCQAWGGEAKLGAVPTFRFGDEPYDVVVVHRGREVAVTVVSFCACRDRHGIPTVIDLSPAAIAELTPTWQRDGVIRVHVEGVPDQHPEDPPEHPDDARMRLEAADDEAYR